MTSTYSRIATTLLAAGGIALAAMPGAALANAQDAATDGSASAAVNPAGLQLPGQGELRIGSDPNVRLPTATVNGRIITGTDVQQRMALFIAGTEQQATPEQIAQLRAQTLRDLIDEMLKIQESAAQDMPVTADEVTAAYNAVAQNNFNMTPQQMDEYLTSIGSSTASLRRQIEGELAWRNLIARNIDPFVNVSIEEVNEVIARLEASKGLDEFNVAEIYLSATPATSAEVEANGRALMQQIRQGANFQAAAAQFSEASTAASGGLLGWVRLPQLPVEIATELRSMNPGQIVGPIPLQGGGYSIIYLVDRRQVLTADPRDATLSLKQITIAFDQGMTQAAAEQRLETFGQGVSRLRGCGNAEQIAAETGAEVRANDVRVRELPGPLQNALLEMQVGQVTSPFGSVEEGVSVLVLCGRDDPKAADAPSPERLQAEMKQERIDRRGERYLRDLRRDAVIELN
ncbi:peptidylprolyl isomerase [Alteriqipengyuania sp. WL0013]|uniref:peptidylprolyl isomerase n=1 Tax=Alteriqipengyuania sp. WL0013 TaxID=3110773 RepID=UPI002C80E802|nr:peptidylprolyl isomerase [Alteriqipengyuania sp. WL0013]MEB3415659.1 peptidylprolyl isomerase [Alteriqipengyuania sp. WL0013]